MANKINDKIKELKKELDNCSCSFGGQCKNCSYLEGYKDGYKFASLGNSEVKDEN